MRLKNGEALSISLVQAFLWILLYMGVLLFAGLIDAFLKGVLAGQAGQWLGLAVSALGQAGFFAALLYVRDIRLSLFEGTDGKSLLLAAGGAVFCFLAAGFAINPILLRLSAAMRESRDVYLQASDTLTGNAAVGFVMACVIGPVSEELLMRGFVLEGLKRRYGPVLAVLISAGLFALMHLNLMQAVSALVLGIVIGHLYIATGSVFSCIVMHALYNVLSFMPLLG